ncbi:MAG: response regulator transcription factor [Thermoleophilia bacterium]|nr:response regulator transcription factor [Thermoleophilia bacterium]
MIERSPIGVVVADDHELVRTAFVLHMKRSERLHCVAQAATGAEAVAQVVDQRPQVALVDVGLPDIDGFDVTRRVGELDVPTRVVLVSSRISTVLVQQGFDAGAWGYLSKASSMERLVDAIEAVAGGVRYVDPDVSAELVQPVAELLDPVEVLVLEQMVTGRDDAAIAWALELEVETVCGHVESLVDKLGCATRGEAVNRAVLQGAAE